MIVLDQLVHSVSSYKDSASKLILHIQWKGKVLHSKPSFACKMPAASHSPFSVQSHCTSLVVRYSGNVPVYSPSSYYSSDHHRDVSLNFSSVNCDKLHYWLYVPRCFDPVKEL